MRIGMLLMGGTYPPDIRVEKEAKVLAAAGHEVFLLTSDKDGRAAAEQVGDIAVRRYPARAGALASKVSALATLTTWRSPLWERAIRAYVSANGIEALHAHDLPAVASALAVGRKAGIPVVFDMHENYPAAVGYWDRTRAATIFQTPERYRIYERRAVTGANAVVTVVQESAERVKRLGAPEDRVLVFGNVDDAPVASSWEPPADFTVVYAGGFGHHRGIDVLVEAMVHVRERVPRARAVIMGAGKGEAELHELARHSLPDGGIEWTGWVGEAEMRSRLAQASVGVVPHRRNDHTDSTVPHKLFQYMAMGLPVTVTDCAPLARIVQETGSGTVAASEDPCALADALVALADPAAASAASEAGRRAVRERYNLEAEGQSLVALYRSLEERR